MATQGLVTVVSNKKVLMKIVTGSDGYNAKSFSEKLLEAWPLPIEKVYQLALKNSFGSEVNLVVIDKEKIYAEGEFKNESDVDELYRQTFDNPNFNPRWKDGVADYISIISV